MACPACITHYFVLLDGGRIMQEAQDGRIYLRRRKTTLGCKHILAGLLEMM
jgi:hypothetical protein